MIARTYIENYGDTLFLMESGSVYVDNFNETLDSMSFSLTNISIDLVLKPLQYFHIIDIDNNDIDLYLVVNNFTKTRINLSNEVYYNYDISLMSETKLLETIILPNRTVIHGITTKTITEVIKEMCELYVPKYRSVENNKLTYKPIFDYVPILNDTRFNIPCPDLSRSKPNLREVLAALMSVVGCIPRIENRTLTYLDLRQDFPQVDLTSKHLIISESNSVDSYTNQLVSFVSNAIDTENNEVINEIVGFRDNETAIIKQLENLFIETSFPIERITELYFNQQYELKLKLHDPALDKIVYDKPFIEPPIRFFNIEYNSNGYLTRFAFVDTNHRYNLTNINISYYKINANLTNGQENIELLGTQSLSLIYGSTVSDPDWVNVPYENAHYFVISFTYDLEYYFTLNSMDSGTYSGMPDFVYLYPIRKFDITKLVKESQVRAVLDVDVRLGENYKTLDEFSTFYYTTLEYTYGGNQIKGFSNSFEFYEAYGYDIKTLMELIRKLAEEEPPLNELFVYKDFLQAYHFTDTTVIVGSEIMPIIHTTKMNKYSLASFEVHYIPFNRGQIKYSKTSSFKYPIQVVSNQDNSIITLDNFSTVEQQKVNRLGNNVVIAKQFHTTLDNTLNVGSAIGDIVFYKKQIEFFKGFVNAVYTGTKNYIFRDFFTSITRKYRAYQYFNINDTIIREENKHYFVVVGTLSYPVDFVDEVDIEYPNLDFLASGIVDLDKTHVINYALFTCDNVNYYRYECSKLATGNSVCLSYIEPFSNSYGSYINVGGTSYFDELGGFVQGRYMFEDTYYTKHSVIFANEILYDFGNTVGKLGYNSDIDLNGNLSYLVPKVAYRNELFRLNDRVYYKSLNERVCETIQFEYVAPNKDKADFTKLFVEQNILLGKKNRSLIWTYDTTLKLTLSEGKRLLHDTEHTTWLTISKPHLFNDNTVEINISDLPLTHCIIRCLEQTWNEVLNRYEYQDLFGFDSPENEDTDSIYFELANTNNGKIYDKNSISGLDNEINL